MNFLLALVNLLLRPIVFLIHKTRTLGIYLRARLPRKARVLDIGSGANPWFRSNVLFEKYPDDDTERCGKFVNDGRDVVYGDAERLPFEDKEFDFIYCSHVAEHIPDIGAFFKEIQRVGKAGYIETPNAVLEQTIGTTTHSWALYVEGHVLHAEEKWIAGAPARAYHAFHRAAGEHPVLSFAFVAVPSLKPMAFWWKDDFKYVIHPAPQPSEATRSKVSE